MINILREMTLDYYALYVGLSRFRMGADVKIWHVNESGLDHLLKLMPDQVLFDLVLLYIFFPQTSAYD